MVTLNGLHWGYIQPTVEGLYCKRPIQCLASSEILTPHPPHRPASVYPPPLWCGGRDTLARGRRGGGSIFRKTPYTAQYSIYVSTLCSLLCAHHSLVRRSTNTLPLQKERTNTTYHSVMDNEY